MKISQNFQRSLEKLYKNLGKNEIGLREHFRKFGKNLRLNVEKFQKRPEKWFQKL